MLQQEAHSIFPYILKNVGFDIWFIKANPGTPPQLFSSVSAVYSSAIQLY